MHLRYRRTRSASIIRALFAFTLVILLSSSTRAQPTAGKAQPDRLTLGSVRIGATVEASVRIFEVGADTAGVQLQIDPPPFLRVKQTQLGTQTYGTLGTYSVCDISVSVNTAQPGAYSAPLCVQVGTQRVEIPVTVDISPREADETRLLVVETPFQRFSTADATLFVPWLELVKKAKLDCHYLESERNQPVLRDLDLSAFDVILLGESGLVWAQEADIAKLKKFIGDGGRVVVTANYFFRGTVAKANELLVPCGLRMTDAEPQGIDLIEVRTFGIFEHVLTKDVRTVRFHRPSLVTVLDEQRGKILVAASDEPKEGFVAVAGSGKGEIVAVGTSLWWNWIASAQESGFDNALLLKNLLTKARKQN
jgi:hypothetical protein